MADCGALASPDGRPLLTPGLLGRFWKWGSRGGPGHHFQPEGQPLSGTWVARNCDASALYVFAEEIDALRFVNDEGYYMEVLLVPHGEDALRHRPIATGGQ